VFKKTNLKINLNKIRLRITLSEFMILRILLFLFSFSVFAQKTLITGQILDKATAEPIPYASVRVKNTYIGTVADSLGKYALKVNLQKDILVFSSVGYFDKVIDLKKNKLSDFTIQMEVNKNDLSEIIIKPDENPAWKIVRKVLENRNLNNPDKYETYQARTHSKLELMLDSLSFSKIDTAKKNRKAKPNNIIFEFVSDIYSQKPGKKKETIFATHTNFLNSYSSILQVLPLDLHKYHFYEELYNFYPLNRIYINPLNSKTFYQYEWELIQTDTLLTDTLFHLNFKPRKNQKFNGFGGNMVINSNKHAIQELSLKSVDSTQNIEILVYNKYKFSNENWFPQKVETKIRPLVSVKKKTFNINGHIITDFKDVKINVPIDAKVFTEVQRELLIGAHKYNDSTFAEFRIDTLNNKEKEMYLHLKNESKLAKKIRNFDYEYSSKALDLLIGVIDLKYFELNIFQTISYNNLEGIIASLGLQSKLLLRPRFGFQIKPRYGFKDQKFKFTGNFSWFITKDRYNKLTLGYKNEYESSINDNNYLGPNFMYPNDFQQLPQSKEDYKFIKTNKIERKYAELYFRPFRYNWIRIQLNQTNYRGLNSNILNDRSPYNLSDLSVHWRLAYKEDINRSGRMETRINRFYPIVNFRVTKGLDFFQSTHQYWKFLINNEYQIRFKKAGILNMSHFGTYNTGYLPTDFLQPSQVTRFSISGINNLIYNYNSSKTQHILGSTFIFTHDFNNILFKPKTKFSKPRISVQTTVNNSKLWLNTLENSTQTYNFNTYSSALIIRNLVRIPFKGFYLGLGGSIQYTYGPNAPTGTKERIRLGFRLF
jgi:CarboxypepD_reg-like domain